MYLVTKTPLLLFMPALLGAAIPVACFDAASFEDPVEVRMSLNTLNLRAGRRHTVECNVNRPQEFFISSPLEFLFGPASCPECDWITLTENEQIVAVNGTQFYDIKVTSSSTDTTFQLSFKHPRLNIDDGELRCRLTLDPRLGSSVRSRSTTRNVLVFL